MKHRQSIALVMALIVIGCAIYAGAFLLRNNGASVSCGDALFPDSELVHRALPPETPGAGLININTASVAQLQMLPGIGPELAQRIVSYRTNVARFTSPAELTLVPGIGISRLEALLGYITTGG